VPAGRLAAAICQHTLRIFWHQQRHPPASGPAAIAQCLILAFLLASPLAGLWRAHACL
jgi:hypothetical protein